MEGQAEPWDELRKSVRALLAENPETLVNEADASATMRREAQRLVESGYSDDEIAEIVGAEILRITQADA